MTLLPPTLAQSTLGEKCAVYIDQITDTLPIHLRSLRHQLNPILTYLSNTPLGPLAKKLPFSSSDQPLALFITVVICLFTIIVMSWRNPLRMLRRSPSYAPASNPQVSDEDFSYITPADVADSPVDDTEPDIISLRHRGTIYPLHFRAYAIDDGVLTIGDLRDAAAKSTGAGHPDCVRLLYKGKLLKNNARTCKAEGIKQHSEVLCVVSEPGAGSPSDGSDDGQTIPVIVHAPTPPQLPRPISAGEASSPPTPPSGKSKKSRNKKRNGKKSPAHPESPAPSQLPRPSSSGHSGLPGPLPNIKLMRTPLEQVTALTQWFEQEMKPICEEYIANPPSDPKKRDFEHRKLGEMILAQVQIKADGIEPDGDEMARSARKALIKDTQATLNKLDAVAKL
ncbi:Ubiquitin supergroup [Penicillium fimorum]|uniref:Ubiquitin supergroup n=1 Tax=Penicillium fimorum TaxID=1882269 RepID=A0A9X0CA79_9EURO|nr:Ubiquitin supergroup [Penicillium fimorum]